MQFEKNILFESIFDVTKNIYQLKNICGTIKSFSMFVEKY